MPFKTFTPAVLTSADVNTYLMKQAVITCTSGTRPGSPAEGMTIYETDTNCYVTYDGSAWVQQLGGTWTSYTPTLTNVTLGNGTLSARWGRVGKTISGRIRLVTGSTTTYGAGNIGFSLPVPSQSDSVIDLCGTGTVDTGSGTTRRVCAVSIAGPGTGPFNLFYEGASGGSGTVTPTSPLTLATGARLSLCFTYEEA